MSRLRAFPHLTEVRAYRLERGVTLAEASHYSGISLVRASTLERFPEKARPGELEKLKEATDWAATFRDSGIGAA
jgi:hypothetical protein